jgi:hypothetical protein
VPPAAVATNTSPIVHIPYLTNKQFRLMQTPVNCDSLVPKGTPAEQEAALAKLILDASTIVYTMTHQLLYATVDTEQDEITTDRWGRLVIHPRFFPIAQVTDLWMGSDPANLIEVSSLAGAEVNPKEIIITQNLGSGLLTSSAGPLEFGTFGASPRSPVPSYGRWTYVNGWPVTTLAAPAAAGATSITVKNPNGILPNYTPLRIEDGADRESLTVTAPVAGNTVPVAALANAHLAGEAVTALPADVETAVGLIVTALVKKRGAGGLVAGTTANAKNTSDPFGAADDMQAAEKMLKDGDYVAVGGRS